ncbi:hypothetical protein PVAND_011196 [Polypedilum vanderplanki]|uniref:ADP-ribosylation factor-related protein 1 n=1 Tax=Polypedilum vanderplanki TaxID=319348 RepID=A0A9J6CID7_POLVA|nr:hypothetical protein PVAND_011196 [Polypedilum vanderplanki]
MYHLVTGFYQMLTKRDEYNILILGLDDAGKSTFLETAKTKFTKGYKGMNLKSITSTVGLNIGQIDFSGLTFNFWDLGGQKELQSLWDKYYDESHGVIYVIDSNDRERMSESKELFDKMIKNEFLTGVPLLILANKQDIIDCMGVREIKPVFQQHGHLIGRRDCLTIPTSGLTGEGVDEAINWLKDAVKRNSILRPPKIKS